MTTYACDKFRPIKRGATIKHGDDNLVIDRVEDAAWIFADRAARATFGRRCYCRHLWLYRDFYEGNGPHSWSDERTRFTFVALIWHPAIVGNGRAGPNTWERRKLIHVEVRP